MDYTTCELPGVEFKKFLSFYKRIIKKDFSYNICGFNRVVECRNIDLSDYVEIKIWERDLERAQKMSQKAWDEA